MASLTERAAALEAQLAAARAELCDCAALDLALRSGRLALQAPLGEVHGPARALVHALRSAKTPQAASALARRCGEALAAAVRGAGAGGVALCYWWSNALALRAAIQLDAVWEEGHAADDAAQGWLCGVLENLELLCFEGALKAAWEAGPGPACKAGLAGAAGRGRGGGGGGASGRDSDSRLNGGASAPGGLSAREQAREQRKREEEETSAVAGHWTAALERAERELCGNGGAEASEAHPALYHQVRGAFVVLILLLVFPLFIEVKLACDGVFVLLFFPPAPRR